LEAKTANLTERRCVPCRGGIPPLEAGWAREYLAQLSGWSLAEDARRISKRYGFADFKEAMGFVGQVADLAEDEGHHPDIAIHYNQVDIVLYTHKIGGLHLNDFIVAAKIDQLLDG
jgi:4a-hydroxytetrahydrobiopterin dehydratase